ncbi:aminopeptidase P family protein [Candidatus Phytoplasma pini]|uniref:Xaa-Pro aminopeptidase n=1 Tax=Candidatus Phytoplasma pini TaxID=267362 RepID=A0A559KJ43_9MOLU|nr:aminopeptidase P family protein [Candidatus Phytoplasma pini]TVY12144.1 xaa-Pro aminopeptidase [Candidatus Phytoplasma pini]
MYSLFFQKNRQIFLSKIKSQSIALFFSGKSKSRTEDLKFPFEINRNFYYLTGIEQENVVLILIKEEQNTKTFLFLEKNNQIKSLWNGDSLSFEKASKISSIPLENCLEITTFKNFLNSMLNNMRYFFMNKIDNLYFDLSPFDKDETPSCALQKARMLINNFPYLKIHNSYPILSLLRQKKQSEEIEEIKKAVQIQKNILDKLVPKIKSSLFEYDISSFYHYLLEKQQLKPSFDTIAASGKNATIIHYSKKKGFLKKGEMLLLDAGVNYHNYASDVTRCYPINGQFTHQQKLIYELVLKTNKTMIKKVRPEHTWLEFNQYGRKILFEGLKKLDFLQEEKEFFRYCAHGLGHYLGLDVHDVGDNTKNIGENSIITVEPGLYFENLNLGIRIEDDILVTSKGNVNLTCEIPKEISEIEDLMSIKKINQIQFINGTQK